MAKFADDRGGEWSVEITVGAYQRLKRDTALDLDRLRTDETMLAEIVYGEPFALVKVMEVLLGEQVKASGLTPEQFADRFGPATVDRAGDALLEAIIDFFHRRRAPALKTALAAMIRESDRKLTDLLTARVSNNSPTSAPVSAE